MRMAYAYGMCMAVERLVRAMQLGGGLLDEARPERAARRLEVGQAREPVDRQHIVDDDAVPHAVEAELHLVAGLRLG